ncbi:MAG: hypothetical protein JXR94_11680 [Candidatus Hydrogenedentes bacterium]|nr:hypothetical protein [Candidatus Hydrogenedentota bacterium]
MPSEPIFRVSNHHVAGCGRPPAVDGDSPGLYHGYFENRYGEQMLLVYDREKGEGVLWCGDAGWEQPYRVVDGRPDGLIMSPEEGTWFDACVRAVRS